MADSGAGPRVALVTNVLSHYRVACFQRLAEALPGRVTYYLLTEEMAHRHYVFARDAGELPVVSLEGRRWRRPPDDDFHWNDIKPVLRARPEVLILGGWSEPTFLRLWLRHLPRRTRVLLWVESTAVDRRRAASRELLKRLLLAGAAGCVAASQRAAEYCRRLGAPAERIWMAPNAADRAYFRGRADDLLPRREELRRELGLERPTFLFVGRLVESIKGVAALIRAVAEVESRGHAIALRLAGEGPDRPAYEALARGLGCRDVVFVGNLEHDALCRLYAAGDALVLPSRSETWGFVLNEAMEFGLPLVVSEAVGAGPDLVSPEGDGGGNGWVVPVGDVTALADALERLTDDAVRRAMGERSRTRIESYSPERWARGMLEAITAVTAAERGRR